MTIKDNISSVQAQIAAAAQRAGRPAGSVLLVGVTKYSTVPAIAEALSAGLVHIAENRVQSAREKFPLLVASGGVRHLIGHLQSNKVKDAVALFDMIQSVDSLGLLNEINKRAGAIGKTQDILLQVDIAGEVQKYGLPESEVDAFCATAEQLPHICLRGLMTMAPHTEDTAIVRAVFHRCHQLFERLQLRWGSAQTSGRVRMEYLSMGMSGDYAMAVEEGATMVRVGSAIFK